MTETHAPATPERAVIDAIVAEINHSLDRTPEVRAAYDRMQQTEKEMRELHKVYTEALQVHLAASDEYLTVSARSQPLRAYIVSALDRYGWQGGPPTLKQIAKTLRRDNLVEVEACLAELIAEGLVTRAPRRRGRELGYAPLWASREQR